MRKNKTYNKKLTKHQHARAQRHQIIILSAVILAAAIIGNQSIKPIFTPDRYTTRAATYTAKLKETNLITNK